MNTPPRKESESGMYAPVWRKINQLIDYMREISVVHGRDVRLTRTLNGTLLVGEARGEEPGETATPAKHYRLKSIAADYMVCRTWGGTSSTDNDGSEDIYIARDPELRRTRYDGRSIEFSADGDNFTAAYAYTSNTKRTKTINSVVETQVIVPYYKTDETVITATSAETKVQDPSGGEIGLVEITQRAWAKI